MTLVPDWWVQPRRVTVVVDNDSWVLPYAEQLVAKVRENGNIALLARSHDQVFPGTVAFYLGCVRMAPPSVLARNHRNLVVHASDLPKGRGFSPLTWLILEGCNEIPVCLLEAGEHVDAGPVIYREMMKLEGHELNERIRVRLGDMHVSLCMRYLAEEMPPEGKSQQGEPTYYARRCPKASRLDPERSLAEQFDLLRVVDNQRYPAFFEHRGKRYILNIKEMPEDEI